MESNVCTFIDPLNLFSRFFLSANDVWTFESWKPHSKLHPTYLSVHGGTNVDAHLGRFGCGSNSQLACPQTLFPVEEYPGVQGRRAVARGPEQLGTQVWLAHALELIGSYCLILVCILLDRPSEKHSVQRSS